jgi:hypothetical protein
MRNSLTGMPTVLIVIGLLWLAIAGIVVAACQLAARADGARGAPTALRMHVHTDASVPLRTRGRSCETEGHARPVAIGAGRLRGRVLRRRRAGPRAPFTRV